MNPSKCGLLEVLAERGELYYGNYVQQRISRNCQF